MARATQTDWGFEEITAKFERAPSPRRKTSARPVRRVVIRARGMMHVGVWVGAVALCLLGLVAVHVGLLEKNMEFNELIEEKNSLAAENARLSSDVATLKSPARIEEIATAQLGMVTPNTVQYVYIGPSSARQHYAELDTGGSAALAAP